MIIIQASPYLNFYKIPARKNKKTVVVVTHNMAIAPMGDRIIQVRNGQVESEKLNPNPVEVERIEW